MLAVRIQVLLFTMLAALALPCPARAGALDTWRDEAARVRMLADNDAPRAYEEAKRLQAGLPADAAPADRARALNLLSRAETYLGLTEPAAQHAEQAFEIASRSGDRVGQAEADLCVALNSINQGRIDTLVTSVTRSVSELEGVNRPDLLAEALLRTAVMYRRFEQFEESVAVAVRAMEIAQRSGNPLALTYAHHGLAIAYDQSYRMPETREHYEQMRLQARASHSRLMEGFAITGLASVTAGSGDLAGGERLSREALALFREVGAPFAASFTQFGLAGNLRKQGRHAEALQLLDESLAIYAKYPNRIGLWFSLNARSEVYQAMGKVAAAHADAEQAYAVAKSLGLAIYTSGSALRLASVAASKGDHKRAYELSVEAREMTTKAAREKASVRVVELAKRYESEAKQREIDELTHRNEQQTAELRQRELQQRWLWTVLAASVALLLATAYYLLNLRRSKNAIRALNTGLEQRVQERTAELRQQARYLRTLIDMLPMWAWFKDTHSRYLVTNQAHAEARGCAPSEMVGKSDLDLLPPEHAQASHADEAEVMASHGRKTVEEAVDDGSQPAWMETYKAAVLDEDGTVLGAAGVARNISERKAAANSWRR
jgi:PAS domain S-box-containing protein